MRRRDATTLLLAMLLPPAAVAWAVPAYAVDPFGMRFGMSRQELMQEAERLGNVVTPDGFETVFVEDKVNSKHSYLFNFCNNKLMEAAEVAPFDVKGLARVVDEAIRQYGQPQLVSTIKLDPQRLLGVVWFWRTDTSTILRVDVVEGYHRQNYSTKNMCRPVRMGSSP